MKDGSSDRCEVIPTPREVYFEPEGQRLFRRDAAVRVAVDAPDDPRTAFAVKFLTGQLRERFGLRCGVVKRSAGEMALDVNAVVLLIREDEASAATAGDREMPGDQGYLIFSGPGNSVVLTAPAPAGLLNACATLVQLMRREREGASLRHVMVSDVPAFRYRGNNWLLNCEISGWSYARGDGLRAYEERVIRKLDWCALHKVNLLVFDGFTWDTDKFPGQAAMMRRINRAARLRSIRLCFGGYGAYNDGEQFLNRKSYPAGATYPCIGFPHEHVQHEHSRLAGTCLSNRALVAARAARLGKFVKEIEPGMLYLHNLDTGLLTESLAVWKLRCPACRKKWPDDSVIAADGMAGAFAEFYDRMADAVREENPDCKLIVVSPGYTGFSESDREWDAGCEYWQMIGQCMRNREVMFGFREQFTRHGGKQLRYPEIRARLDRRGLGQGLACIYFYGGDFFFNNHPFLAGAEYMGRFRGAELVMNGNGSAYQEPQQLLHAEAMWNPEGSRFFDPPKVGEYKKFVKEYYRKSRGEDRPAGIFGRGGFLDEACARLYGSKAGPLVAEVYRMEGKTRLGSPGFARYERSPVWMPVFHYLHPAGRSFRHCGVKWRKDLPTRDRASIRRLATVYREVAGLNRKAEGLMTRAAKACTDQHAGEDLKWMAGSLAAARRCAEILPGFLELFLRAHKAASGRSQGAKRAALAEMARFERRLARFEREMKRGLPRAIPVYETELVTRAETADRLRRILGPMRKTLGEGWPAAV